MINWSMLEGFVRSLDGHIPKRAISELVRTIGDDLRRAGVVDERLGDPDRETYEEWRQRNG
jgi:hypothetical protein